MLIQLHMIDYDICYLALRVPSEIKYHLLQSTWLFLSHIAFYERQLQFIILTISVQSCRKFLLSNYKQERN